MPLPFAGHIANISMKHWLCHFLGYFRGFYHGAHLVDYEEDKEEDEVDCLEQAGLASEDDQQERSHHHQHPVRREKQLQAHVEVTADQLCIAGLISGW